MTLPTLVVGGTNIATTRVGFGCARIYGAAELRSSARLLEAALDAGIRHFDTAPAYGNGKSEEVLGIVLSGVKDITITTKIGVPRPQLASSGSQVLYRRWVKPVLGRFPLLKARLTTMASSAAPAASTVSARRLVAEDVLRELETSLTHLRRDSVDFYLIHEPDGIEITDELCELFESLRLSGRVGGYGLAWGRNADTDAKFGTVLQGRYHAGLSERGPPGCTRIIHGILRDAIRLGERAGLRTCLRDALARFEDLVVLFSASTPRQISEVASAWQEA